MKSKLNLETELLLNILKGNEHNVEKIISKKINWDLFLILTKNHELLPCVYFNFKNKLDLVPPDISFYLEKIYEANLARNLLLGEEFLKIYHLLTQAGVEVVPLKGLDLEIRFQTTFYRRIMKDIDILIKKKDLEKTIKILEQHTYQKYLAGNTEEYWLTKQCHLAFKKDHKLFKHGILIEVHWALDIPPRDKILTDVWDRIRTKEYNGNKFSLLSPEDSLFSLILHNRRFGNILSLKQVLDLKQLCENYTLDTNYILKSTQKYELNSALYFALTQTQLISKAPCISTIIKGLSIPYFKKNRIKKLIHNYTFSSSLLSKKKEIYLKAHFLLYDKWIEPLWFIINIPYEQFCKFYNLKPYTKLTNLLYYLRFISFLILKSFK